MCSFDGVVLTAKIIRDSEAAGRLLNAGLRRMPLAANQPPRHGFDEPAQLGPMAAVAGRGDAPGNECL